MRKKIIGLLLVFSIAVSPFAWLASAVGAYPPGPFGGGGGDAFPQVAAAEAPGLAYFFPACGPWCQGLIGYLIGKAVDYTVGYYIDNAPRPGCGPNACGGGGGDAFPGNTMPADFPGTNGGAYGGGGGTPW